MSTLYDYIMESLYLKILHIIFIGLTIFLIGYVINFNKKLYENTPIVYVLFIIWLIIMLFLL